MNTHDRLLNVIGHKHSMERKFVMELCDAAREADYLEQVIPLSNIVSVFLSSLPPCLLCLASQLVSFPALPPYLLVNHPELIIRKSMPNLSIHRRLRCLYELPSCACISNSTGGTAFSSSHLICFAELYYTTSKLPLLSVLCVELDAATAAL